MRTHAFRITLVMQFCPAAFMGVTEPLEGLKMGGGVLCFEWGFMRTFPRNQDVTVKLKSELIFIKFWYFFNVLADPKPICFTQTIPSMCES